MRLYVCTDHDSHYPVGCASIVISNDEAQARRLLDDELTAHGLMPGGYSLQEIELSNPIAKVLCDGDY